VKSLKLFLTFLLISAIATQSNAAKNTDETSLLQQLAAERMQRQKKASGTNEISDTDERNATGHKRKLPQQQQSEPKKQKTTIVCDNEGSEPESSGSEDKSCKPMCTDDSKSESDSNHEKKPVWRQTTGYRLGGTTTGQSPLQEFAEKRKHDPRAAELQRNLEQERLQQETDEFERELQQIREARVETILALLDITNRLIEIHARHEQRFQNFESFVIEFITNSLFNLKEDTLKAEDNFAQAIQDVDDLRTHCQKAFEPHPDLRENIIRILNTFKACLYLFSLNSLLAAKTKLDGTENDLFAEVCTLLPSTEFLEYFTYVHVLRSLFDEIQTKLTKFRVDFRSPTCTLLIQYIKETAKRLKMDLTIVLEEFDPGQSEEMAAQIQTEEILLREAADELSSIIAQLHQQRRDIMRKVGDNNVALVQTLLNEDLLGNQELTRAAATQFNIRHEEFLELQRVALLIVTNRTPAPAPAGPHHQESLGHMFSRFLNTIGLGQ